MAGILVILGLLIAFVGGIWLLVVTFKESILWGIGSILIPFVSLVFVILNWEISKKPFLIQVVGLILMVVGVLLSGPDNLNAP